MIESITPEQKRMVDVWLEKGAYIDIVDCRVELVHSNLADVLGVGYSLASLLGTAINRYVALSTYDETFEQVRSGEYGDSWRVRIGNSGGFEVSVRQFGGSYVMKADLRNNFEKDHRTYGIGILIPNFLEALSVHSQ